MKDINVILADHPDLGRVQLCECNSIHLSIGPVTMSMTPQAFAQAAALMRNAMDQLSVIAGLKQVSSLDAFEPSPGELTH
jgi:hypothetical protein